MKEFLLRSLPIVLAVFFSLKVAGNHTYCVPIRQFDPNPFREIKRGMDLAVVSPLITPVIASKGDGPGVLSRYHFSKDGRTFYGEVDSRARFGDGRPVSALEAGYAIAKGLGARPIGARFKVAEIDKIELPYEGESSGLKIVGDRSFRIRFSAVPKNSAGVLTEALSSGSMQNRLWVVAFTKEQEVPDTITPADLTFRWPLVDPKKWSFSIEETRVSLVLNQQSCRDSTMTYYPGDLAKVPTTFDHRPGGAESLVFLILSTKISKTKREAIIGFLRSRFSTAPKAFGFTMTKSFFRPREPGGGSGVEWSQSFKRVPEGKNRIFFDISTTRSFLEWVKATSNFRFEAADTPRDADFSLLMSTLSKGRLTFSQDLLKWQGLGETIKANSKLFQSLSTISSLSAATIPTSSNLLEGFERVAFSSKLIAPLGRRVGRTFTKKDSTVTLVRNQYGDLAFVPRKTQ